MITATDQTETIAAAIGGIAPRIRADATGVAGVARLSGGAVNEIWAFDLLLPRGEAVPLVLRRGAGGERTYADAVPISTEAGVVALAARAGVPVATPRYTLRPEDGLGDGFVGDRIDGETIGGRIARGERFSGVRPGLARRCGEVLASIHALDPAGLGLATRTAAAFLDDQADRYRRLAQPRPVLALALRWLYAHCPAEHPLTLVHGDFRNGNMIVGDDGLRAVLDWEGVHVSDPMADLGYLSVTSWRFGVLDRPVGGFGRREDLFEGYAASGGTVDPARARWWELFGSFRWGVMCAALAAGGGALGSSPVETALIARRASESEIDLLDQLTAEAA